MLSGASSIGLQHLRANDDDETDSFSATARVRFDLPRLRKLARAQRLAVCPVALPRQLAEAPTKREHDQLSV